MSDGMKTILLVVAFVAALLLAGWVDAGELDRLENSGVEVTR